MKRAIVVSLIVALTLLFSGTAGADRDGVVRFATLPEGPGHPEGIAADAQGNIYVASFAATFTPPNFIYVFGIDGLLQTTITLPASLPLGMSFDAVGNLYVADFGNGDVLKFTPPFTSSSTPARVYDVCGGAGAGCALNAIAFDGAGLLHVSDSFGGNVFTVDTVSGTVGTYVAHELLRPGSHAFPPFGANGLAFDAAGNLYVANTGDDRVLKVTPAKVVTVFAESVNGADGIAFDAAGRLWVCANQADELVALDARGRVVDRRGSFEGIGPDGAPRGLLFPASLVMSRGSIYATNTALALTPAVGDEPEEDVTTFTVSRIPLRTARR